MERHQALPGASGIVRHDLLMTTSTILLKIRLFAELGGSCVFDIAGTLSCWAPEGSGFPVDLLGKLAVEEEVRKEPFTAKPASPPS